LLQNRFILTLSAEQKQRIIDLLASGKTATQAADDIGCSRATVQRVKGDSKNAPLLQIARGMATAKQLSEQGDKVVGTLQALKEREPQIQEGLWMMFEGLKCLFEQVLRETNPQDISPRQLPVLAKSAADIANAYADFTDRINGLTVLVDEIEKINKSRAA
jgi:hypothetical protein